MFRKMILSLLMLTALGGSVNISMAEPAVHKQMVIATMQEVYPAVYESLENARFYVVFEPNISKNLASFSERWGENYNRNRLDSIRSMVFCNAWYANAVSNADPDMLALCPLRVGLYEKQGQTTVVFARPSVMAMQSPARGVLEEAENEVIEAIENGLKRFKSK